MQSMRDMSENMRMFLKAIHQQDIADLEIAQAAGFNAVFRWYIPGECYPYPHLDYAVTMVYPIARGTRLRAFVGEYRAEGGNVQAIMDSDLDMKDPESKDYITEIRAKYNLKDFVLGITPAIGSIRCGLIDTLPIEKERMAFTFRLGSTYTKEEADFIEKSDMTQELNQYRFRMMAQMCLSMDKLEWWIKKQLDFMDKRL